jgi:hypothetical protein
MARLIQSIFSGGKTGATGSGGFTDEELADYQKALLRGRQATGAGGNPVLGAAGGLLGQMVRKKFFPTQGEEATDSLKQARIAAAKNVAPTDPAFNREVLKQFVALNQGTENPAVLRAAAELSSEVRTQEASLQKVAEDRAQRAASLQSTQLSNTAAQQNLDQLNKLRDTYAGAKLPPAEMDKFRIERGKEFRDTYAVKFNTTASTIKRILALPDTGAGDFQLVNSFIKLVDDSIVTSEEFAAAAKAAGVKEELLNKWREFKEGDILSAEARNKLRQTAILMYQSTEDAFKTVYQQYETIALDLGVPQDLIPSMLGSKQKDYVLPDEWWEKQAGKKQFNLEFDDNGNVVARTDQKQAALEGSAPNQNWADKIGNFFKDNFGNENDKTEEVTPVEEPKDENENIFNF